MSPTIENISLTNLSPIQKTLFIPLTGRALAKDRFPNLEFQDLESLHILNRVGEAPFLLPMLNDRTSIYGTVLRAKAFDEVATDFLNKYPLGRILNLGSGLCTRNSRIGPNAVEWCDADLTEVISLKEAITTKDDNTVYAIVDLNDLNSFTAFFESFVAKSPHLPVLIILEGVGMFLNPNSMNHILFECNRLLPNESEIVFDYIHPAIKWVERIHPSLQATGAKYQTSFRSIAGEISHLNRLNLLNDRLYTAKYPVFIKVTDWFLRNIFADGESFFDVARIQITNEKMNLFHKKHADDGLMIVANTILAFIITCTLSALSISKGYLFPYVLGQFLQSIVLIRAFCLLHDLSHRSVLKNKKANDYLGYLFGILCVLPFVPYKKTHMGHHTWLGWKDKDPTASGLDFDDLTIVEQRIANFAWKFWIPLLSLSYSVRTFWNYSKIMKMYPANPKSYEAFRTFFSIAIIPTTYVSLFLIFGSTIVKIFLPAFILVMIYLDPLLLSQEVGIPIYDSKDHNPKPFPVQKQERFARTLIFPYWISRYVLLGFNFHSMHHMKPSTSGHLLGKLTSDGITHKENALEWFIASKRKSLNELFKRQN